MLVRSLALSDAADAQLLLQQLGDDSSVPEMRGRIERILVGESHFTAVAEASGRIVGLVHAFERPALEKSFEVVVQSLVVRKDAHRSGIGRVLMRAVEQWTAFRGIGSVVLHTRNAGAFYEKLGYKALAQPQFMRKVL
jgi:GNAT superfamily N-acetyltransferase